jgi:2-dehydro-3-deoxygluconokinase
MQSIACIGEAMIELSVSNDDNHAAAINFAGDSLNTAIYLNRALEQAAHDCTVSYVSVVGTDSFSSQMLSFIESENLNTDLIGRHEQKIPGLYAISTDSHGERSFTYWRNESAAKELFSANNYPTMDNLLDFDVIFYSAISLAILPASIREQWFAWLENYRKLPGKQVAFDSNYRPKLWDSADEASSCIEKAWHLCDIALPSMDDEMAIFNDDNENQLLSRFKQYGVARGAVKRGHIGPRSLETGLELDDSITTTQTQVVDSTAAGDSFNGAYLASLAMSASEPECLLAAHETAAKVIMVKGAIVPRD